LRKLRQLLQWIAALFVIASDDPFHQGIHEPVPGCSSRNCPKTAILPKRNREKTVTAIMAEKYLPPNVTPAAPPLPAASRQKPLQCPTVD